MKDVHILNLGAGVQSTTLYLMFADGLIKPQVGHAVFADTGDEPRAVYRHLDWLVSLGGPPILRPSKGNLGDNLVKGINSDGGRFVSIPAFTTDGSRVGQTRRQCSREYKIRVIEQCIRRQVLGLAPRRAIPKDTHVHQYFGISLDEAGRATRLYERYAITGETKMEPHFPLIERKLTRQDCKRWLRHRVPHEVPRSACVYCPFHSDAEWLAIKADPEDWLRAVEIDTALRSPGTVTNRNLDQEMFLHRSCRPLTQIEFKPKSEAAPVQIPLGFQLECMGVCGV